MKRSKACERCGRRCRYNLCRECHKRKTKKRVPESRKEAKRFYASAPWRKAREQALIRDKYQCQFCKRKGRIARAEHVHHLKKRTDYPELALDVDNLESLCIPCHSSETGKGH